MKSIYYFPVLVLITSILTLFFNLSMDMNTLVFNSLSDKLTQEQVVEIMDSSQKWQWLGYVLLPLILLLKIAVITAVLYMGIFFFEKKITYKRLFTIVTKAEFVFVLFGLVKLLWFVFQDGYTLEDVQSFYPLSALNVIGYQELQPWFVYPFQTLNLFELAYWIILAWLLSKEIQSTTDKALKIVASSYGSALLIWVVAVMFFTLNMS
ncbi:hypothetical protein [Aquimarina brevivitae]|uniref:Yip1-like protein n=1 Tax=Aquimarina brevivitae TaxID=323412 RepID=A0A4Q7PGV2_9FLAO|nr:hypothetical protein [Aquimarina brevivitae]RZS99148.1 hypothetical protein EV197_0356 [Aquimarina brevivitae]